MTTPGAPPPAALPRSPRLGVGLFPPAWSTALADAPPEVRTAWLAAADAARAGVPAHHLGAAETYRALAHEGHAGDGAWTDRLAFLFTHDGRRDPLVERLALACAARADGELGALGGIVLGECASERGDDERAEAALTGALARTRGTGSALERRAAGSLAEHCRRRSRDAEAFLLARRALALLPPGGADPREHALLSYRAADALRGLDADDEADAHVAEGERALAAHPETVAVQLRRRLAFVRLQGAVRRRRGADAEAALADLERLFRLPSPDGADPRWLGALRAGVALRADRLDDARRHLAAARAAAPAPPGPDSLLEFELELAVRDADGPRVTTVAARMLDDLEAGGDRLGSGFAMQWAVEVVEALAGRPGTEALERRAHDAVGRAVLRRIAEIERATTAWPELASPTPAERDLLAASRQRFRHDQAAFLDAVGRFFVAHPAEAAASFGSFRDGRDVVRVCAWCRQVARADGTWVPVGHYLPPTGPLHVTHGICAACRAREADGA